jgi:putative ABC transport system permease protein
LNPFRAINTLSLLLIVALITAVLTLRARSDAEWQALVTGVGGEDVITFRLQRDAADAPSWTPGHLTDLGALTGVSDVFWRGGYAYIQGPASAYVLPLTVASPGFLSARQVTFVAGRDLSEEDAGRPRVVLNQQHAREIFPELSLGDILGQEVRVDNERLEIVGIAADHDEVDAAFRAARTPPLSYPGRYDIQTVYLRLGDEADAAAVVEQANAYLAATEALAMLEAVPYREFVRPGVIDERLDYVREVAALFGWLVAFAILLGVINLVNQALLSAAARRQRWALHRVLGATRGRLVARELLVGSGAEWAAVAGGVLLGGWLGARLGGLFNLRVGLSGVLMGGLSLLLGSAPLVAGALTLHPYGALRQSRGLARHPLLALLGGLGLLGGLALVVVAGGFRDLGQRAIGAEVEAIGADLVALVPDRRSILPVAHPTEEDVAALRAAFPEVPVTRFERHLASVRGGDAGGETTPHPPYEAEVIVADDAFVAVSGTPLEAGRWEGGGVVLGSAVAAALFPEGDALGRQVTLEGQWSGSERTFVVEAVAAPPPTERLEALALRPDAVLLPRTLASPFALSAEVYARVGGVEEAEALAAFVSARYPRAAPTAARYAADGAFWYLERLEAQTRQFGLVALLIFVLAAVGIATLTTVRAEARAYVRGLERAFGATQGAVFRHELAGAARLTLWVGLLGISAGLVALWGWAQRQGYPFVVPSVWLVAALGVTLGIGLTVGVGVARWSAARSPLAVLRGEG